MAAVLFFTSTCFPVASQAQEKIVLKIGWTTSDGATDPYAVGARAFKKEAEERTGGRVEVQLFPNRQLGDERPMLDGMRLGTVDGGVITNGVISQVEPSFQINDMPFLYSDEAQAQRILDGEVGQGLSKRLEGKGIVVLGFMEGGFRHMINNVRPVNTPDDIKGVKYRVLQNPIFIEMFRALGGNAVPMAWGETFTAVQQGAIDGLEIPLAVIDGSKFNEVTKFLSLTNHTYSMIGLVMSKRAVDRMPADIRRQVIEAAAAATASQRKAANATARELVGTLRSKGMQVNEVRDLAPFRKAVLPLYESFRGQIGADVVKQALAAVQ
ncbi:MAG: transporter [Stutzerimonas stutzeri]|nr:MAG: transporter [Stutzerimonas stutzeri]